MTSINPVYNRIEAIFKLRGLGDFADFSNARLDTNFWQQLTELQAAIYRLDSHYENNREIALKNIGSKEALEVHAILNTIISNCNLKKD